MDRFVKTALLMTAALGTGALAGCNKAASSMDGGSGSRGRYVGVGIYAPDEIWEHLSRADAPKDAAAATLADDDVIVVVLDSASGELRQCGNLSGHCIAFNPWAKPVGAGQGAPVRLLKHAQQLAAEAKAEAEREGAVEVEVSRR